MTVEWMTTPFFLLPSAVYTLRYAIYSQVTNFDLFVDERKQRRKYKEIKCRNPIVREKNNEEQNYKANGKEKDIYIYMETPKIVWN